MAGVDRTGEAAAIYQMVYMGKSKKEALEMLGTQFAHFESNKPAKIYFIRDLWQDEEWARDGYEPCKQNYKFYDKNNSYCNPLAPMSIDTEGDT
jgi:hypothetical protein